jgi:hypothetical protein
MQCLHLGNRACVRHRDAVRSWTRLYDERQLLPLILAGISVISNGIVTAYFNVVAAVIYHDLRAVKEGVDIEAIAAVFD